MTIMYPDYQDAYGKPCSSRYENTQGPQFLCGYTKDHEGPHRSFGTKGEVLQEW